MNRQGSMDERDVAQRAYRRYEARGFEDGHDMDDWLEAEREAREERSTRPGGSE
jgi:urease accessory protein UreF